MANPIIKGTTYATGQQVTATNLNNLVDAATFDSDVVDNVSLQVSGDQLSVKDGGITSAKHATDATNCNATRTILNRGTTALTDTATIATDASTGNVFTVTLGGNRTLGAPSNLKAGATYIWIITQDGTGSRTLSFNSVFKWPSGTAPTLTTTAAAIDIISGVSNGTNIYCTALLDLR